MTAHAKQGTVDELMKEVGQQQIQYGQIVAGEARGVLGVAEPEYVERLDPNVRSVGTEIRQQLGGVFGPRKTM
jgi:hypothetical protein